MTPATAKKGILERLVEFEDILLVPDDDGNLDTDYHAWVKKLDEEVASLIRGLKLMCFDNGEIRYFNNYQKEITFKWNKIKENLFFELEKQTII